MNPAETTAMLVRPHEGEGHDFLGTCFSLKEPTAFVTAAHIVGDYAPADLSIFWPGRGRVQAAEAHRHPSADIAVLRATSDLAVYLAPEPFTHAVTNYGLAEDFIA